MLLRFSVRNHLSLRDEEALTLTQSALKDNDIGLIGNPLYKPSSILPAAIIYGANASGKSNVVAALEMMQGHVVNSHSHGTPGGGIPRSSFALDDSQKLTTSKFEIDFITSSLRYNYGFETDGKVFTAEWLYCFPSGRIQKLFERKNQDFSFGRALRGQNKTIEGLTRNNSLFVSAAAQNDHEELLKVFSYVKNINFASHISVPSGLAMSLLKEGKVDERVIKFLERIGTGVVSYKNHEIDLSPNSKALTEGLRDLLSKILKIDLPTDFIENASKMSIQLGHKGEKSKIEYFELARESAGTRRLLVLLGLVFSALDAGSVIVIDELDASLHTQAVETLIAMFSTRKNNPKGAQLVATVHDTNILRSQYLRRDQIWFTEKDEFGATRLFPMSDIQTHKGDNLEKGYLEGRYGATAFSGPISNVISDL